MWSVVFTVALQYWIVGASPQSNYAERGVDIEYQGNGIPQEATLDGIVTKLDDLTHVIRTNKSVVVVVNRLKRRAIVFNAKTLLFFLSAGHRPVWAALREPWKSTWNLPSLFTALYTRISTAEALALLSAKEAPNIITNSRFPDAEPFRYILNMSKFYFIFSNIISVFYYSPSQSRKWRGRKPTGRLLLLLLLKWPLLPAETSAVEQWWKPLWFSDRDNIITKIIRFKAKSITVGVIWAVKNKSQQFLALSIPLLRNFLPQNKYPTATAYVLICICFLFLGSVACLYQQHSRPFPPIVGIGGWRS